MKKVLTHWIGISSSFSPEGYEGFVYLIVNTASQKKYIGKKFFWAKTRKKTTKLNGKPSKKRKLTIKESDWRTYKSSSDELKSEIARLGPDAFTFTILSLCKTRAETNYLEVKVQFERDVLYSKLPNGEWEYYNYCVLGRYWRKSNDKVNQLV